ncbi:vWA domain-containing protein [Gracilibacillus kekensis]|uniref:von Willebrand factor type A domain-containing protein n=1 Tax=Gracilibacillus kekensis TaxID=1027249 RepID=A0A1M7JWQ7_9BACI|nr:BatA and WFA domain-containing protein [Gracilibacillus kekensis]SHM57449.1 von Willebrand factor type A domain-containing protein [Gracilibacillus kekensis]
MGFLAPISFWFLTAIPILLLFYFFKKQFDQQNISSIYLWERTFQEWESDHWWRKLQKNLLLLLQLLILLFLILALTRPYLENESVSGDHLVIVMDTSATMMMEQDGTTRLAEAKEQAEDLVDSLGSGQQVSVIQAGKTPAILATNQTDHNRVREQIRNLEVSYQHQNLEDAIQLATSFLQQGTGEVHIFTDHLTKEHLTDQNLSQPVVVHNRTGVSDNISLQSFGVKQTEDQVAAIVTVANQSSEDTDVALTIRFEDQVLTQVTESISANEEQTVRIDQLPVYDYYQVEIEGDGYLLDNEMHALLPQQQAPSVYIAGEVNPFIEQALLSAGHEITSVTKNENGEYAFPEHQSENIYLLAGVQADQWPSGSKLIMAPATDGPFGVNEKGKLEYGLQQAEESDLLAFTNVQNIYLEQAYPVEDWHGLQPLVQSGEQTILAQGIYQNDPIIFYAFDFQDSDWPLQPDFPILLANSIAGLAESSSLGYYAPLETAKIHFSTMANEASFEALNGEVIKQLELGEREVTMPGKPGIYQLHEITNAGSVQRHFVVQLDPEERTNETADSFSIGVEGEEAMGSKLSKREIWRVFAAIALLILFVEWEVYRRGITSR